MKHKLQIVLVICLFIFVPVIGLQAQNNFLSIKELQDSVAHHPKSTLLLIHTDWCTYCQLQQKALQKIEQDFSNFYLASMNAEYKEKVVFKGEVYRFEPNGKGQGIHELVKKLSGDRKVSYPYWVILDEKLQVIDAYSGYLKSNELIEIGKLL